MFTRPWQRLLLLFVLALGLSAIAWQLWHRPTQQAQVKQYKLTDGSSASLATPAITTKPQVLLLLDPAQQLQDGELLALAQDSGARILQLSLPGNDCDAQQHRLQAATEMLQHTPTLVAGIGPDAAFAWRWLATQNNDAAQALSVGFSLQQPDCAAPLPERAAHGHWNVAWNNNPDDPSAGFARAQDNAQTSISDYNTSLTQLLKQRLMNLLQGHGEPMPVVEVAASQPADTVTLFYSGDGGWRDLDRDVAAQMAKRGYPVVGIDALRYFWQHKSPQQGADDLGQLMRQYREKWGAKRFVLAGYSFGADALPAFYNRLTADEQQQVDAILLLALARSGSFQIEVQGWLGKSGQEAATGPELSRLPAHKVLCVYGQEEGPESGCTQPGAVGEALRLPGGHHYDENYPALADKLLRAIEQRQANDHKD
ncbi:MAG: AcvB/VirJ family lysyl-phosphatidylglycerol hydrolase [Pseudomonas sp.]|uniref:virulence factor family protein n=1 Tax=Pseudomonas sp. TaxID=306 RepID=UPI0027164935|nr:AcvB/VirJ family lysyl-phosphatidylglycerol hydrolase [Pseudomonas sp.]MDO9618453.1 AcvB/VirJ family lysyl-phosphatidylglycerol hydrolase [Pseudomonas sp.]MDP2444142.1 AcvB/VirJ family lysyl-phosphatidylglycerol hydrolase [Pseudomonas sp.]MDZ4337098.1 AcvB/VirJ family lysyl-phosphatidylglycerol hydrolase [Pseudomonas sp.]